MAQYDQDAGAWVLLPAGEHLIDLGEGNGELHVVSTIEVPVHTGPIHSLNMGRGSWRPIVDVRIGPTVTPRLNIGSGLLPLPIPPPESGYRVLLLAPKNSPARAHELEGRITVESSSELRIEILAEGELELIGVPYISTDSAIGQDVVAAAGAAQESIMVVFDGDIQVDYGFFFVCDSTIDSPGDLLQARAGQENGLCGTKLAGQVSCVTGLHTGCVSLRIEWLQKPDVIDAWWEDVVEASVEFSDHNLALSSFEDSANLTIPRSGWHRVRYSVSEMDAGREVDTLDPGAIAPDRYLLQFWPAPPTPDHVSAAGSDTAAYWHRVALGQTEAGT